MVYKQANFAIPRNHRNIPPHIRYRVKELVNVASQRGVLRYIAYQSALKYLLENEYPYILLDVDTQPLKGYSKCIRIWREMGLIKSDRYIIYNPEQVERHLRSYLDDRSVREVLVSLNRRLNAYQDVTAKKLRDLLIDLVSKARPKLSKPIRIQGMTNLVR